MEWLSKPTKRLICEMSAGILVYNVILMLLAVLFLPRFAYPLVPVLAGLAVGAAGAILMLIHMAVTAERVLEVGNESYANKNTVLHSMIRKLVFIAAIFFCWRMFRADLLAAVIGAMGMKAGAYLQPLVHRFFGRAEPSAERELSKETPTDSDQNP